MDTPVWRFYPISGPRAYEEVVDQITFAIRSGAFRRFFCPGCGSEIENEIAVERDPPLRDIEITA